jgi:Family of unknown function (DUF5677)
MDKSHITSIEETILGIKRLHSEFESLIQMYRNKIEEYENELTPEEEKLSTRYCKAVAYVDSLIKLRIFIEQNFNFIETMGVLSVTRYIFELSVWLKLLIKDDRYGLVYQYQLLDKQLHFYSDLEGHLLKEIEFFKEMDGKESDLIKKKAIEAQNIKEETERADALRNLGSSVQRTIDDEAAKRLCIYVDDALTNGYGYQAHLIEQNAVPNAREGKFNIRKEIENLKNVLPKNIKILVTERWNWKQRAKDAGMSDEYEFIYSYTSRLLHATPASLTTDQKNLEPGEIAMFLRYIAIRMKEVIADANKILGGNKGIH